MTVEVGEDDDLDSRYSKLYEEEVNPFAVFNRKVTSSLSSSRCSCSPPLQERYKRYKELNAAEKVRLLLLLLLLCLTRCLRLY